MSEEKPVKGTAANLHARAQARAVTRVGAPRKPQARVAASATQDDGATLGGHSAANERGAPTQAEAALAHSKAILRTIFDGVRDGILCADIQSKRFVIANTAICRMLGYTCDELLELGVQDVHAAEDLSQVLMLFDQLIKSEILLTNEVRMKRKDGAFVAVEITSTRNELLGHTCAVGVIRDITARQQAELEKLRLENTNWQLQKAESLGRMAGAIAHHFNNKLMAVMGNLELALDAVPHGTTLAELLSHAMQASKQAVEVSQQMLTYLGLEQGSCAPLDLAEICRQHVPILQAARPKQVTIQVELPCPGPVVTANAHQVQQILTNLVVNAWDAIGDHPGSLQLTVSTVTAAAMPAVHRYPIDWQPCDPAYACLAVTDTGSGIADQNIKQLFDPFFSTKFTGRGLGLPVILGIVRACHGAVSFESELGRGSTFRVFLPVTPAGVPRAPERAPAEWEMEAGGTVLLVEDEDSVRHVAAALLTSCGFAVLPAADGNQALALFRQHQDAIDCVLCNLTMPGMDGWHTIAALRQLAPAIPVVLTSGYKEASVMVGDHPAWPQVFLSKPYHAKSLRAALSQAMAGTHTKTSNK